MNIEVDDIGYTIDPDNTEEDLLFRLLMSRIEPLSKKDMDDLIREYNKLEHCENYVQGKFNFKCGLPKGHKGDHMYIMTWKEDEGFYSLNPRSSQVPWREKQSGSPDKDTEGFRLEAEQEPQ